MSKNQTFNIKNNVLYLDLDHQLSHFESNSDFSDTAVSVEVRRTRR
jgi:hypothetical protein